ncbi:hypothetical protein J2W17_003670 [Pseudomonas lini]|uniref:hypothetical protein n=1 Tax=Pseudomonas lini TaxID=163011 RepID=UPI002787B081|nr:hypothetical protein [Pseudomonas lini]MDQ0124716.1 hypothetical protein [Pseudomonas lini]
MAFYSGTNPVQQFWQCDKLIGPTFERELIAADLLGEHFTQWHPGYDGAIATIEFFEDTPQEVIDGVLAVFESHDPAAHA